MSAGQFKASSSNIASLTFSEAKGPCSSTPFRRHKSWRASHQGAGLDDTATFSMPKAERILSVDGFDESPRAFRALSSSTLDTSRSFAASRIFLHRLLPSLSSFWAQTFAPR